MHLMHNVHQLQYMYGVYGNKLLLRAQSVYSNTFLKDFGCAAVWAEAALWVWRVGVASVCVSVWTVRAAGRGEL